MDTFSMDLSSLPKTLIEWRTSKADPPRKVWDPLESWFATQGLRLHQAPDPAPPWPYVVPSIPGNRVHDGTFRYTKDLGVYPSHIKPIHCFATSVPDGRDVLIRLIQKGDQGREELEIQRWLSDECNAFLGANHCLPMQRELALDDMVFGVFARLDTGFSYPWYDTVGEVFNSVIQLLEGLDFMHQGLVAHRDIGEENILINLAGGVRRPPTKQPMTFRTSFPIRYFYIDFELSTKFSPDSSQEERVVTGLPVQRIGIEDVEDYGREVDPAWLSGKPYDPFKSDIYQLGKLFHEYFQQLRPSFPVLVEVFDNMISESPSLRPAASEALKTIRAYRDTFTGNQLKAPVPPAELQAPTMSADDRDLKDRQERKAARKAKEAAEKVKLERGRNS